MIYKQSGIIFIVKAIVQTSIFTYLTYFILMSMKSFDKNDNMVKTKNLHDPHDSQFPSNKDDFVTVPTNEDFEDLQEKVDNPTTRKFPQTSKG